MTDADMDASTGTALVEYMAVPDHFVAEVAGEVVILHRESGVYYGLNPLGRFLWDRLQTRVSVMDLAEAVVSGYEVDVATATQDVEKVVSDMVHAGLVERHR